MIENEKLRYLRAQVDIANRMGQAELVRRYRLGIFPCDKFNDEIRFAVEYHDSKVAWDKYYARQRAPTSTPAEKMLNFVLGYISMKILLGGFRK